MKIDLIGGTSEYKYPNLNSERTINWYVNISSENETGQSKKSLFTTPGLDSWLDVGGTYGRCIFYAETVSYRRCFIIIDVSLYEIFSNQSYTLRGSVPNFGLGSSKIYAEVNGNNQILFVNSNAAYVFNMNTDTLTLIPVGQYPGSAEGLTYSSGYFLVPSGGRIYYSPLNDGINWDILRTFTPDEKADPVKAVVAFQENIYCFGTQTMQIYLNDGTSPFSLLTQSTRHIGLLSKDSVQYSEHGIYFLGRSGTRGQSAVYSVGGDYNIQQISDFAITAKINTVSELENSEASLQHTKDGHVLYNLSIPNLNTTFVYDITTKIWTERQSTAPFLDSNGDYIYSCFRGKHFANFEGLNLFLDRYSGKILLENYDTMTEDTQHIRRLRRSSRQDAERKYITINNLEIYSNTGDSASSSGQGSDPILMLRISKDSGFTFGPIIEIPLGILGDYTARARTDQLGTSRSWVFEFILTDPCNVMIQDMIATGTVNAW